MMANVIKTTYPLRDNINNYTINLEYNNDSGKKEYSIKDMINLMREIQSALNNDNLSKEVHPIIHVTEIGHYGRASKFSDAYKESYIAYDEALINYLITHPDKTVKNFLAFV